MHGKIAVKKRISTLLSKSGDHSFYFPDFSRSKSYLIPNNSLINDISYKGYIRFNELPLPGNLYLKHSNIIFLSQLLNEMGKYIKEFRIKRLFEIYLYLSSPAVPTGLYHYYIKNHSLERLVISESAQTASFIKNLAKEKSMAYLVVSLRSHFLPHPDRLYWYWLNIFESGRLVQALINKTQTFKNKTKILESTTSHWNDILSLNQSRESVIQVLRIY